MEHASVGPIMKLTQKCQAIQSNNDNQSDDNLNSFFPEYYCPYTDTRTIGESLISRILEQLLSALIYFHSKNIIHRDIKVENILFTHDGSIKLSDFGSSSQLSSECAGQVDDTAGTFLYWSPEICDEDRDCALYNGFKADIWALGMTMWICLFSKPPYYCDSPLTLFEMIAQQEDYINSPDFTLLLTLPHICSTPLADVLRGLLQREPHKRLSSEECSQMPFITDRYTSTEIDNTVRGEVNFSFIIRHRIFQWKRNAQRKVKRQCDVLSSNIQNSIQSSSASARDNIIETNTSDSAHLHEQGKTRRNSVSNFIASAFRSLNPFGK